VQDVNVVWLLDIAFSVV